MKKWHTDVNSKSYGYDGKWTLESPYWSESEELKGTLINNTYDITASNPGSVVSGAWAGGKYKCNVSSTGNYLYNQNNNTAYDGDNDYGDTGSYKTIPWWFLPDIASGNGSGLDTVITGKDFISSNTSSFKYYLPS